LKFVVVPGPGGGGGKKKNLGRERERKEGEEEYRAVWLRTFLLCRLFPPDDEGGRKGKKGRHKEKKGRKEKGSRASELGLFYSPSLAPPTRGGETPGGERKGREGDSAVFVFS